MATLSPIDIRRILSNRRNEMPVDDFRLIDSWAEYDDGPSENERPLKYLCYEIEVINPDTGETQHLYKALKFLRIRRLPREAKQSTSLMDKQAHILSSVYENQYNMVTVIANIIQPQPLGLLYLYGVQGVAKDLNDAKKRADSDFIGLCALLQGTYRVLHFRVLNAQETEWLREKMYGMEYLTMVRGIPKASKTGEDAGTKGVGNKNLNPDSDGTLEEIISGMVDYEYVIQVLSTPVFQDTLEAWQTRTQLDMTNWNGQLQGTKSLSANLSMPMMYMASTGQSQGWSQAYTDAESVSYSQGESFSMSQGESIGQSLSQTFGQTFGRTQGTTVGESISESQSVSIGSSIGKSMGVSETVGSSFGSSRSVGSSQSMGASSSENLGTSQNFGQSVSKGTSIGRSLGESLSQNISATRGSSVSQGQSVSAGKSFGTSESVGTSESHGTSTSHSESHSISTGESHSTGASSGTSQSIGHSQSQGTSQSESSGQSSSISHGTSSSQSGSQGTTQGSSSGTSTSDSESHSSSVSIGSSHNSGTSGSTSASHSSGTSASEGTSKSATGGVSGKILGVGGSVSTTGGSSTSQGTSTTDSSSVSKGTSESHGSSLSVGGSSGKTSGTGTSESQSQSSSQSSGWNRGTSDSQSEGSSHSSSVSSSQSVSQSQSQGSSVSTSRSDGFSHSESHSAGTTTGVSDTVGASHTLGTSKGESFSESFNVGKSDSISSGVSQGHSVSATDSLSDSLTEGYSESAGLSHSVGTSKSTSIGSSTSSGVSQSASQSQGQSASNSQSQSSSQSTGVTTGHSTSRSESVSQSESTSTGRSESATKSSSVSTGQSTSKGTSTSKGSSIGSSGTVTTGASGSMGLGPSIGYSKSYQWLDQQVKDILELLEYQNERIKQALRGNGAFYTYVYIAVPSLDALSAAQALAKSTWQNEMAMVQPLQVMNLTEEEQKHLLYHFSAFSSDVTRIDNFGASEYKYSTVLLPSEFVAYTHLPRISEGGVFAEVGDVPHFAVPSMMQGEIYMGSILSAERYSMKHEYETPYDYRIAENELMHGFFTGASRSGKTVAAMRFVAELSKVRRKKTGKRLRIVCMDPKQDWRALARFVEPERFRFYSMGNPAFHPLHYNPCKIPRGVIPQIWVDVMIEIYCRAYGLLERGKQLLAETFYSLYQEAGVFDAYGQPGWEDIVPSLSANVTFTAAYSRMELYKRQMDDGTSMKGRGGNDTKDAYSRLLERLSAFSRPYSIERRLFGEPDGLGVDDIIGNDDVTVLESKGLESTFRSFIFGTITAGFYRFAIGQPNGFLAPDQYETVLVIEEANEVLTGSDTAGTGNSQMGLSGQSEFEQILDQSAGYGLFIFAITQKIADMPKSVIANSGLRFIGKIQTEDDINVAVKTIAKDPRYDDRDVAKWFPRSPTGWFVCQSSRTYNFTDIEPVLVHIAMLNVSQPSNAEIDEIIERKKALASIGAINIPANAL